MWNECLSHVSYHILSGNYICIYVMCNFYKNLVYFVLSQ